MLSLNTILKLKAGVRATARLTARVKNDNHGLRKEKLTDTLDPSSPNSLYSPFPPLSSLSPLYAHNTVKVLYSYLIDEAPVLTPIGRRHDEDAGVSASEVRTRFVRPNPYVCVEHPLVSLKSRNSSNYWEGTGAFSFRSFASQSAEEGCGKAAVTTVDTLAATKKRNWDNYYDRVLSSSSLSKAGGSFKDPGTRLVETNPASSRDVLSREICGDWGGGDSRCNSGSVHGQFVGGVVMGSPRAPVGVAEGPFEKRDIVERLMKVVEKKVKSTAKTSGCGRGKPNLGKTTTTTAVATVSAAVATKTPLVKGKGIGGGGRSLPLKNRLVAVRLFNGSAIIPRVGLFFTKNLHEVSFAREGIPSDRSSEQESNDPPTEQSSDDGKSLKLVSGACNLPHPDKVKTGGEDAYFICSDKQVVGVADGVGGWADLGIDAGEYARELMSQSMIAVQQEPPGDIDPSRVMEKAHSLTKCKGSSTACILALSDSVLAAANLGDSGFVIVRNSRTIFKSPVQQHQFNIPFQLECGGSDPPSSAQVFSIKVMVGDVIVAGTDGLFDNVYDTELTTIVVQAGRGGMAPQVTAQKIANLARTRAQDKNRQTPFSTAAQDAGYRFYGGKMDDITVIVSYITSSKSATSSS